VAEEDAEDLPENILDAVKGNKIEEIVNWLDNKGNDDNNSNKLRRVNFITHNGTFEAMRRNDLPLMWLLLQKYHAHGIHGCGASLYEIF
jgi:hypothetical protein